MRRLALIIVLFLVLPATAFAAPISLTANASIEPGTAIGPTVLIKCPGYVTTITNPWVAPCQTLGSSTTLNFGELTTQLKNTSGADMGGAGCFYSPYYFIVYLFPDAWGGTGYIITQQATSSSAAILDALIVTPVYSPDDKYSSEGDIQDDMTSTEESDNPLINTTQLAKNPVQIFKSTKGRIVRAHYGIPPYKGGTQTWATNWAAIPLTTTADDYSVSITITMSEYTP